MSQYEYGTFRHATATATTQIRNSLMAQDDNPHVNKDCPVATFCGHYLQDRHHRERFRECSTECGSCTFISDSCLVRTVRLARRSSRGVTRCSGRLRRTLRLASRASSILACVDVTWHTNQPVHRRSYKDSSNDTSYVRPSASRTCTARS